MESKDTVIENRDFRLTVGSDAEAKSLILLSSGEELLDTSEKTKIFSVTEERPYNNEIKLSHPNTRTVFPANSVTKDGDVLTVGFEIAPFKAKIKVKIAPFYVTFTLLGFDVGENDYPGLSMRTPPVSGFCLLSLPVKNRKYFGSWLNVSHDDTSAAAVVAVTPEAIVSAEKRVGFRILRADAEDGTGIKGTEAALIACGKDEFLSRMDALEKENGLPLGVESRRGSLINASIYFTSDIDPANADEHIRRAKQGGFRMMQIYYTSMFKEENAYSLIGNYDYRESYPEGRKTLEKLLKKIKDAGIVPGLHVLQTHIGINSRYVTPEADARLRIKRHYTLSVPLSQTENEIFVEEDPAFSTKADKCRLLRFGKEIISYEDYTEVRPYKFTGCRRGAFGTNVISHPDGEIGGLLDVSEYGGTSVYLDQNTSLADEIADKIADAYNAGFEFIYFDGSEGTNAPFGYHVPMGQYRVWKKLTPKPLFCEGAAKAHFGWHFLSAGNAFDVFAPEVFKEKIKDHPAEEAPRMKMDFTQLNFGWWGFRLPEKGVTAGTQADLYEYGISRAFAWDCPVSVQTSLERFDKHPRTDDILEVIRRWEDVRANGLLAPEAKEALKDPKTEHHLVVGENGEYGLYPYRQITTGDPDVRAFIFKRNGKTAVLFWHLYGSGDFTATLDAKEILVYKEFYLPPVAPVKENGKVTLRAAGRQYLVTDAPEETVISAFGSISAVKR